MSDQVRGGILSPFLQKQRVAAILPHLRGRVLDWGCGNGVLAEHVSPDGYIGVDPDRESIETARSRHPSHTFLLPHEAADRVNKGCSYDSLTMLAVIEHVPEPAKLLAELKGMLSASGRILMTTPHPLFSAVHTIGGVIGLFSREASEEHQPLLGPKRMKGIAESVGLEVVQYTRFLGGANQLFIVQARGDTRALTRQDAGLRAA